MQTYFRFNLRQLTAQRGAAVALVLLAAIIGFEIFNFDTTRFALNDIMSGLRFFGIEWASILAFAFCGIDFAGVTRIFTPQQTMQEEPKEVWMLMGAWLLGATMNACMTWYAMGLIIDDRVTGMALLRHNQVQMVAPIFIAMLVWLTRLLLIGSISITADSLIHNGSASQRQNRRRSYRRPSGSPRRDPNYNRGYTNVSNGTYDLLEDEF